MKKYLIKLVTVITLIAITATLAFTGCEEEPVVPGKFTLKITVVGEGTTSPAPGTSTITEGKSVTVTAIPNTGYQLGYWEGDVSGTDDSITFKMTSDKSVVAVFVEEEEVWGWPETLVIASEAVGSGIHAGVAGLRPVLQESTGMKVRDIPEGVTSTKVKLLRQGMVDMFVTSSPGHVFVIEGSAAEYLTRDCGPYPLRVIWLMEQVPLGYIVRGDSDVETIYDLKGKRIAYSQAAASQRLAIDALLAWVGLTWDDCVKVPYASFSAMTLGVMEGSCDVAYATPVTSAAFEAEAGPRGIRWLEVPYDTDPEGLARFMEIRPTVTFGKAAIGCQSATGVKMCQTPYLYLADDTFDTELAYNFAKWMHENFDNYKDKAMTLASCDIDSFRGLLDNNYYPVHEGTIRYLKEVGYWTADDDIRQEYNLELVSRYVQAYQEAIETADATGSKEYKIDPANEKWVELWENYKEELGLPPLKVLTSIDQVKAALEELRK